MSITDANQSRTLSVVALRARCAREVWRYLSREPLESVFLRSLIERMGIELAGRNGRFVGVRDSAERLGGVLLLSPLLVPLATWPEAAEAFGREVTRSRIRVRNIVGRRETVQRLWAGMGEGRPRPRLVRERQPVYWVDRAHLRLPAGEAAVRRATLGDLELVARAGAAMMIEEVEEDPLRDRPREFRQFVRERLARGDEYVWTDAEGLRFKCTISARTADVAQIEGVYTPPARRRQGHALHGLAALCQRLLREVPCLCLYVNDFNTGAIRLYERLGFQRAFDYQSIFFSSG